MVRFQLKKKKERKKDLELEEREEGRGLKEWKAGVVVW
jgi:hypothetical protein